MPLSRRSLEYRNSRIGSWFSQKPITGIMQVSQLLNDRNFLRKRIEHTMQTEIPADLAFFVQRMVAERRFLSEGDVLAEGLRLLQARETLRKEVRAGFEQLDAGLGIEASEVYRRAEERIQEIASQKGTPG